MIALYKHKNDDNIGGVVYSREELEAVTNFEHDYYIVILDGTSPFSLGYEAKKDEIRQQAIDYQYMFSLISMTYGDLAEVGDYFTRYGKKYGLLKEFRENGIC